MLWLKRLYFWLALLVLTLACLAAAPFYVALAALFSRDLAGAVRYSIWGYGRAFIFLLRPILRVRVTNQALAKLHSPCIIAPNHQSFLDIYLLAAQDCSNLCFVVAKWPFTKLFFFAFMMHLAQYVRVGRDLDNFSFRNSCQKALDNGATLVCFPEGTRSKTGALQDFHSGIFRFAAETGTKVVPMVFRNTGTVCPPGTFAVAPEDISIVLLEPLTADPSLEPRRAGQDLKNRAREAVRAVLEQQP